MLNEEIHMLFEHGFKLENTWKTWKYLKWTPSNLHNESVADQNDDFANVFVRQNSTYGYDVVMTFWRSKFTADTILFREIKVRKEIYFNVSATFSVQIGWNKASCSNNFFGTRQMLMHEKTCVIPILRHCHSWLAQQYSK